MRSKLDIRMKRLKITQKISLTVFGFAIIPVIILFLVIIHNIKEKNINDAKFLVKTSINQIYADVQKTVELCNMSTQVFISNTSLINYLERIISNEKIHIEELIVFNRQDIVGMERLVNSNPYLYQIRVYVDSDNIQEMYPIIYHKSRMENKDIDHDSSKKYSWQYDFTDQILQDGKLKPNRHIMALTSKIPSYTYGNLGYIEVSVRMESVFKELFKTNETAWYSFVDEAGNMYYDDNPDSPWVTSIGDIKERVDLITTETYEQIWVNGQQVIIGVKPIPELNGKIIEVLSLNSINGNSNRLQSMYIWFLIFIMGCLIMVINIVVKTMAKRFYVIFKVLKTVQKGNLDVVVPDCGMDELGELAEQINVMLSKIKQLMQDNINREVLAKNSEIRALQNQINAHFIYNVLECVKMMAEIEEKYDIADAVTSLGVMLRYSMKGLAKNVTVRDEIEYIQNYIALMNLRFDYEIYLSLNIPEVLWDKEIPKMSLQPIVENAINHGIEDIAEDTNIYIKGIVKDNFFLLEITDQGKGMSQEEVTLLQEKIEGELEVDGGKGSGIGLKNVQDRIKIHFGERYGLQISSKMGCYTKVTFKIPM